MNAPLPTATAPRHRETIFIAVFGGLWGLMEITLGVILKGLRVPFSGAILATCACVIFLTGRYFCRRRGAILMMGAVAAMLKIFSIGTVIAGPFLAIMIEALVAEILISFIGVNRIGYFFTGMTVLVYTILHPFLAQGLIFGANIYKIYLETGHQIMRILHLDLKHVGFVFLGYFFIHVAIGGFAGWLGWILPRQAEQELAQMRSRSQP